MSDKNFKENSYPLNSSENQFLPNNNENQIDRWGTETLEKPEKFEKFRKNFSKTLAASLAILNLFSGNFNLAKATDTPKVDN